MSSWTYVRGMVSVDPIGESTTEKEFVVHTVLDHLPPVTGSEKNMCVYPEVKYPCPEADRINSGNHKSRSEYDGTRFQADSPTY